MLLGGLDTTSEYISSKDLVASEISTKYSEIEEVGNGSYGSIKKTSLQGLTRLKSIKTVRVKAHFVEEL